MWLGLLLSAAAIAIGVLIGMKKVKATKKLLNEGKIIKRDYHFAEKGEEFTAHIGSLAALGETLNQMPVPCKMQGNTAQVNFTGTTYAARLYKVDFNSELGMATYRFEFTAWKTYRGMYEQNDEMNMVLTAVEKAFLSLDAQTTVGTYDINFKTKHSFL